ncbi:hypothetical protein DC522_30740 [Microvirga sp. KLBC 81]|uniref:hypothetical protein n=1 Tax=Microvirga sp. KLBC 81 TaxID=1862707 RepID=UPI000D5208A3|nr:hypothetical protein [Microvirga sp. KLBC 81]PVE20696.1 hypothetical protein DC522_30740 [Microvirga sp. KLBC 81]
MAAMAGLTIVPVSGAAQGLFESLLSTPAGDWVAIAVAVLGLVVTVFVTYVFSTRYERSQERKKQEEAQSGLEASSDEAVPVAARTIERYLDEVGRTMAALHKIPDEKKIGVADKLRELITELSATHRTLIESTEFLVLNRIEGDFNEKVQEAQARLYPLVTSEAALNGARTHCHRVAGTAWEFRTRLDTERKNDARLHPIEPEVIDALVRLENAMIQADRETILPGMQLLLASAWQTIEDIGALLNAGEEMAARKLRLLARRRLRKLHEDMRVALRQMDEMAGFLDQRGGPLRSVTP